MHLLVPYIDLPEPDPVFEEFTYGDEGARGKKLLGLKQGDHVFFHTSIRGKKLITAHFVVDRVLPTSGVVEDQRLLTKYSNPHINAWRKRQRLGQKQEPYDAILFADPIFSRKLAIPLPLDRNLITRLGLDVVFKPGRSEAQTIVSATRSWRELSEKSVAILQKTIAGQRPPQVPLAFRTGEEVAEALEVDIQNYLAANPSRIGKGLTLQRKEEKVGDGRADLVFRHSDGSLLLVEVKLGKVGLQAVKQLRRYMDTFQSEHPGQRVTGALVCGGVMPAYIQKVAKQRKITIYEHGWTLQLRRWSGEA